MMMCKGHIITIHMQTMHMFPHMSCSQTYHFFIYDENVTSKNNQTLFVSQFTMADWMNNINSRELSLVALLENDNN